MTSKLAALKITGTAALSLASALACGRAVTGCGSSPPSGGTGSGVSSGAASGASGAMSGASGATSGVGSGTTTSGMSGASAGMSGTMAMQPCPTPTFMPPAGAIMSGTNVSIAAGGTPIFFTTDGTMPTRNSPPYNAGTVGIQVTTGETFQAISSTMGATCTDSAVASATYTIETPVIPDAGTDGGGGTAPTTPTFTPGGTATTQPNDFTVSLTSTAGATLCYTLGATAPTCTSTATAATCGTGSTTYAAPIAVNAMVTAASATPGQVEIQAIACAPGEPNSAVAQQLYTLQAATPTMTPAAGAQTYSATLMGAFASTTTGSTIDYTSNGTAPSCGTPVAGQQTYTAPFVLQSGSYQAIACKTGYLASTVEGPSVITVSLTPPTITPAAGALTGSATLTVSNAANPTASWVCYSTSATVPACGAAGVCTAGTLLPTANTITGLTNGVSVQVIACAPAGLSNSTVATQGPYTLQLPAPVILPDATTVPAASYTLPTTDGTHLVHLNIVQASVGTATDQAGGYMCWLEDPGVGIAPACGPNGTCLNGSIVATGAGPTDIEGAGATMGVFGAGDSVSVITCPGTTAATGLGFAGSTAATTVFVGQGQAMPPTITATDTSATQPVSDTADPWFSKVNAVLTNPNDAAMTVCYTTNGTNPVCTPGSAAAGCATVDGTSSQNLNFKITAGGVGYVNPPTVVISGGGGTCTGGVTATLTTGAVSGITATGCSGYTTPPSVTLHTGTGATASGTASETVTLTVSVAGAGYTNASTVLLTPADGVGSCMTVTPTVANGGITAIAATGCTFDEDPTVSFGGPGAGAMATARVVQTVTFLAARITGGSNYTASPAVTLKATTGTGGTCTAVSATETAGAVTAVTATGCSGFADVDLANDIVATFASQGPMDGTANAAAAIAVPGNSISIPAIENNPTTLKTLACNAGLGASPIVAATYDTQLQDPTIVVTDTLTGTDVTAGGIVTAGDTLTISTTSNFTDTTLVYTADGTTTPNCTGTGTVFTGASTTIPVPDPSMGTIIVRVFACGANQAASTLQHRTFAIDVAAPVITSEVGTLPLGATESAATTNVAAQNPITATIKSPTPGAYMCYSTNGTTVPKCGPAGNPPACVAPNAATQTLVAVGATATVNINTSGETINAIACEGANHSTITGPVVYALDITPVVVTSTQPATCAVGALSTGVVVGFDVAAPSNTSAGGITTAATVCYSTTDAALAACAGAANCFVPTATAPTVTVDVSETGNIYTVACKPNFAGTPVAKTLPVTVTAYAPPTITVDGVLNTTEWSTALGDQFPTNSGGTTTGGFTFNAAGDTLFFSQGGFTAAAGTSVILYVRDDTAAPANATTTTARLHGGNPVLPFRATYAIEIATNGAAACPGTGCAVTTYTNAADVWAATAFPAKAVVAASALEASVAIATLPVAGADKVGDVFDVAGEVYNTAPTNTGLWSVLGYSSSLCSTPLQSAHAP
jgi:hypothetical protein